MGKSLGEPMENMKIIAGIIAAVLIIGVVSGYFVFYRDEDEEEEENGEEMFELTIAIEGQGTVEVNEDEVEDGWAEEYEDGTDVDLVATADNDWYFDEWTGDYDDDEEEISITMDSDKEITATFDTDETTYDLTVNIEGEGIVEVNDEEFEDEDTDTFIENTEVDLEAIADDGWEFDEWAGDASGTETTIDITMDDDKTITAVFEEEDDPTGETWNAYDFESEVDVEGEAVQSFLADNDDENKTLQEFTYNHTFVDEDGQYMNFTIETSYEGVSQTEITVLKYDMSDDDPTEPDVKTTNIPTYELEHHIDVEIEDDENHPDWIDMKVHIPVENFSTEEVGTPTGYEDVSNFWIYSKVEFTDANDNKGLFSYHLTEEWKEEMDEDNDIFYAPYVEDDFDDTDYDEWVLYGIYGHCWSWFQPFAEDTAIEEGTYTIEIGEEDFSYYIENTTVELSGYKFDGFHIGSNDIIFGEEDVHLKGTFVPSLPVPVYLRAGQDGGDSSYTMELTEIVLEDEEDEEDTFELTTDVDGEGTIDIEPDQDEYEEGTDVTLTAVPDENWYFEEWTGDHTGTDEEITITMDDDKSITANFDTDETTYDLTINIDGDGIVEVDEEEFEDGDSDTFIEDTEVDLEAIADDGWEFDGWTGTEETGESITITMDDDKTITAVFEEEVGEYQLTIEIENEEMIEGTVKVDGDEVSDGWTEDYDDGTEVNLEAIPEGDWEFEGWGENDELLSEEEEIDIEMNEDRTITAYFSPEE